MSLNKYLRISEEVQTALAEKQNVVALETTVITHGLPFPTNVELAQNMEATVRANGAVPATVGILDGQIVVGCSPEEVARLAERAKTGDVRKISTRDYPVALANKECGGTTVAGTLVAAQLAGVRVFATGGIGGVHRGGKMDISADLIQLSRSPVIVVCAGAKAILDIPATLEYLETMTVPVIGYKTDHFPAFYSTSSGYKVTVRADHGREIAAMEKAYRDIGQSSAFLVTAPPPAEKAIPNAEIDSQIEQALAEAEAKGIRGQAVTPFLLEKVAQVTHGRSMDTNLALLLNNARVAAEIAVNLK